MQLEDVFNDIIDIHSVDPYCKPQPEAYQSALKLLAETRPQNCLVIDDSLRNLQTAHALGFRTVLVGTNPDHSQVDFAIKSLKELNPIHLGS